MATPYNLTVQLNVQGPKNLNKVINNINSKLNNVQATVNVKTSAQTIQALNKVSSSSKSVSANAKEAANAMEKFGTSAGLAVKRFGAFTAATVGFYAITRATQQSLAKFIEFDRQITRIAQVTNTSKDSLSALSAEITKLSTSLGASSSELASVAVTLSQAGLSARETTKALEALALTNLAPTFNNLNQTVEGSIALMKQFSISTNQLESALGSINAVAGSFAVEAGDLITAVQRAGGVFASASQGVSQGTQALNEFLAVFTSVRSTTREGAETIATGLRTIFTRIQRADTIESLKEFGVVLTDLQGKFVGPYEAIQRLSQGLKQLDPRSLRFSGIVEELGGFRQVGKVIPLIQRFTTAQQALNVAQQGSGSLARDAATGQDALAVKISKVQEQFDALIRSIGETSEFRQFIQLSLDLASALIQIGDAIKPIIPALGALGAAKVLGGVPSIARGVKKGFGFNTGGFVPGVGNTDTVEAVLTPGEYVIRKAAVKAIGRDTLERVNSTGKLPGYNKGGQVEAQNLLSSYIQKKITRAGTQEEYNAGRRINARDRVNFQVESLPIDASPKIGNTEFEQRVAATVGGQWKGGNAPVDVIAPQGPIEVRNRKSFTPPAELADKLARYYGDTALQNKMQLDNINLGKIFVAYNTGKLDEKKRKSIEAEGRAKKIAPKSVLGGAKKRGFDFTKRANTGGPISGRDTVDALLTPGEYVINERAAKSLGQQTLDRLNKADKIGFNKGGAVGPVRLNKGGPPGSASASGTSSSGSVLDSTLVKMIALQAAVSGLNSVIGDETKATSQVTGSLQSLASGITTGLVAFQTLQVSGKKIGKLGIAGSVAIGAFTTFDGIIKSISNSASEFTKRVEGEKLSDALDKASNALDSFTKNTSAAAAKDFSAAIAQSIESTRAINAAESGTRASLRQGFVDYVSPAISKAFSFVLGSGDTSESARLTPDREAAASRVRAEGGITGGFAEFFDPDQFNREVDAELAKVRKQAATRNKEISDLLLRRAEFQVGRGASVSQASAVLKDEQKETIARSDANIAKQLDKEADPNKRKKIIEKAVQRKLQITLQPIIADRQAGRAQIESDVLQVMLSKLFNRMEQAFDVVAKNTEARFARASNALSASLGQTRIGYDATEMRNIFESPEAFSAKEVSQAIGKVAPLLGGDTGQATRLALASREMGDNISSEIEKSLVSTRGAGDSGIRIDRIKIDLQKMINSMNLGSDITQTLKNQLGTAFAAAKRDLGDNATEQDITERIQKIANELPAFNEAFEAAKQAFNTLTGAQNRYSQAVQEITQAILQQRTYLNKAATVRREGALKLREALGERIDLTDIIQNTMAGVAQQTGGVSNVEQLFQKLQRGLEQRERIVERRDSISGDVSRNEEFMRLTQSLAELDVQLAQNRAGLETLANSTTIADAALNRLAEIQNRAQEKLSFGEKLATSTPEELMRIQQTYSDLQKVSSGIPLTIQNSMAAQQSMFQARMQGGSAYEVYSAGETALANQKGNVLSLLKEMKAFFPDSKAFNEQYRTVLQSFLEQSGLMNDQFRQAFAEAEGTDTGTQRAIAVYNRAINIQDQANRNLANLIQPFDALTTANYNLQTAINNLSATIGRMSGSGVSIQAPRQRQPIRRQSGGVVYANEGQYIEMKPKGTDTVPAMLTRGEFVVNAKATKKNRGLLEQINNGGRPSFDSGVAYAADGGAMTGAQQRYNFAKQRSQISIEDRYAMLLAQYRNAYSIGVQRAIPIQVRRGIRNAILLEEARLNTYFGDLAYGKGKGLYETKEGVLQEDMFDRMGTPKQRSGISRADAYRKAYNRETPAELLKQMRLRALDQEADLALKELNYFSNSPKDIYRIAKKYGFSIEPGGAERQRLEAKQAKEAREQREKEARKAREAEQSKPTPVRPTPAKPTPAKPTPAKPTPPARSPGEDVQEAADRNAKKPPKPELTATPAGPATVEELAPSKPPEPQQPDINKLNKSITMRLYGSDMKPDGTGGLQQRATMMLNRAMKARSEAVEALENRNWLSQTTDYWLGENFYSDQIKTADMQIGAVQRARNYFRDANNTENTAKNRIEAYNIAHSILHGQILTRTTAGPSTAQLQAQEEQITSGQNIATDILLAAIPGGAVASRGLGAAGRAVVGSGGRRLVAQGAGATGRAIVAAGRTAGKVIGATGRRIVGRGASTAGKEVVETAGKEVVETAGRQVVSRVEERAAAAAARREFTSRPLRQVISEGEEQAAAAAARREVATKTGRRAMGQGGAPRPASIARPAASQATTDVMARGYTEALEQQYGSYDELANALLFRSKGGIVKPKYFSAGGLAAADFQALAKGADRYPAMLSRGEMVMNPEATRRNKGLLKALNRSRGGMVKNGITYADNGTDGGIGVSAAGNGELRVVGEINVNPGEIPPPPPINMPSISDNSQAPAQDLGFSMDVFSSLNTSTDNLNTSINNLISTLSTQNNISAQKAPNSSNSNVKFDEFTKGAGTFSSSVTSLDKTIGQLREGFGVLSEGSQNLLASTTEFSNALGRFNQSVSDFTSQTNDFINRINGLQINGTITVEGSITMQPLTIDIAGLEAIESRIAGFAEFVTSNIATALAQDNPGMNTSSLTATTQLS